MAAQRQRNFWRQHEVLQTCFQAEVIRNPQVEWGSFIDEWSIFSGYADHSPNHFRCRYLEELTGSPAPGTSCRTLIEELRCDERRPCRFTALEGVQALYARARLAYSEGRIEEAHALHFAIIGGLNRAEDFWDQFERSARLTARTSLVLAGLSGIGAVACTVF